MSVAAENRKSVFPIWKYRGFIGRGKNDEIPKKHVKSNPENVNQTSFRIQE